MGLIRFALNNAHAVLGLAVGLCLLGLSVIPTLPVDVLPDFKTPVVTSFFSYPGLPTQQMEKSVTSRIERALTLADNVDHQESRTMPGASVITVVFEPGTDPASALNEIVNLEAADMYHLPPGIEHPFTLRSEPGNMPVVLAAISGEGLSETELHEIGYYAVRNKMAGVEGVQIPHPFGGKFRQMMVYVDPEKLRAYDLSAMDVVEALRESNLVLAGGTLRMGETEYQVHPISTLPAVEDIEAVPIAVRGGSPIFIRDIGYVKDDAAIQTNIVRVNGNRSVYCPLLREPGANTIAVMDRIHEAMATKIPEMKARGDIPEATEVTLIGDQSIYIRTAMRNLAVEVLMGALLVSIVVFAFLRRFKPTLVVIAVVFLSILAGAVGFYFTGHTINVMTLGGLALAVGTAVDAGIVVVENIIRHLKMGKSSRNAARDGAAEVTKPVLAGTATTIIVFVPVIFLSGMIHDLFEPVAVAATLSIGASYVIAMTIIPAFCARFLRGRAMANVEPSAEDEIPEARGAYTRVLGVALRWRWLVAGAVTVMVLLSLLLIPGIGTELFPEVDTGTFEIRVSTTPGARLEVTEELVKQMEDTIREVIPEDEVQTIVANIGVPVGKGAGFSTMLSPNSGPDTAFLIVSLDQEGRSVSTQQYIRRLRSVFHEKFPEDQFLFVSGGIINAALNQGVAAPIDIQVGAGTLEQARATAEVIVERVRKVPGAVDVQIAQSLDYPQLDIHVDRARAEYFGLTQEEISKTILTALGSSVGFASTIWIDPDSGVDFFMGVQYATNEADSLETLRNIPLSAIGPNGPMTIPLSNVAAISRVNSPAEIAHYNIGRVYDVYVNVAGRDLGSVAADVDEILADLSLESGVSVTVRGPVATMESSVQILWLGLLTAVVLIYLVMMAQFRSLLDPLLILLAVPSGLAGVFVILYLTGTTLNIQSLMGILMMIGVAVNNSILLVEFANTLRDRGVGVQRAALLAAQVRLRPVLMTFLVLVASMLPMTFHFAPGSEAMIPLARAVVGGMTVSTILTLFLVPCVYCMVKREPSIA